MTKKDYVLIASAIVEGTKYAKRIGVYPNDANSSIGCILETISNALKADNDRFDKTKFIVYIQQGNEAV